MYTLYYGQAIKQIPCHIWSGEGYIAVHVTHGDVRTDDTEPVGPRPIVEVVANGDEHGDYWNLCTGTGKYIEMDSLFKVRLL